MGEKNKEIYDFKFISTSGVYKTPFSLIIFIQLYVGFIVILLANLWLINSYYYLLTEKFFYEMDIEPQWWLWLLLPLNIYGNLFLFTFTVILFSSLINKMLPPSKEGVFLKGSPEWRAIHRRFWNAYFPLWLARALPLPWVDIVAYHFFGTRIGKNVVAYEGYIDPDLVEIGDYTMTSLHICIFSHLIFHDRIYVKKVKIGKYCIVGPQTIITPGTIMQNEAILGANSYTWPGQELEENLIHVGTPVSMKFPIQSLEESRKKVEKVRKINLGNISELNKELKNGGA
ncbi:MAG: hypothetical protein ACP6IY_02255 [Promethearchaeia archaeon]